MNNNNIGRNFLIMKMCGRCTERFRHTKENIEMRELYINYIRWVRKQNDAVMIISVIIQALLFSPLIITTIIFPRLGNKYDKVVNEIFDELDKEKEVNDEQ